MKKGRIAIFVVAGIDVVVLVVFVVLSVMKTMKTATMDIMLAPQNATLIINGEKYGNGAYKVFPGKVTAQVVADGFESENIELELKDGEITKIWKYLLHAEDGLQWYASDLDELGNLAKIGSNDEVKTFLKKMSIREKLPYYYNIYDESAQKHVQFAVEVDTIDCPNKFCLQAVNIKNSTNDLIDQVMKNEGYEMSDYEVYYF